MAGLGLKIAEPVGCRDQKKERRRGELGGQSEAHGHTERGLMAPAGTPDQVGSEVQAEHCQKGEPHVGGEEVARLNGQDCEAEKGSSQQSTSP